MQPRQLIQYFLLIVAMLLLGILLHVWMRAGNEQDRPVEVIKNQCVDLLQIKDRERLDITLGYNSLNYYILHGKAFGFQYELAKSFADYLGVELSIIVTNDLTESIQLLLSGKCDIVCADITMVENRFGGDVVFTEPYAITNAVLVQNTNHLGSEHLTSIEQLSGKTIYIPRKTIFAPILRLVTGHMNIPPYIIEVPNYGSEQLIDAVAEGKIHYTIADNHLANFHKSIYPTIDVSMHLYSDLPMSWCMRRSSPQLLDTFNIWLTGFMKTREYQFLHYRYFQNPQNSMKSENEYFSIKTGKISPYDKIIKKYSKQIGWDWRLISSLIYEESHFKNDLVSYSGAYGIMQMMPGTAENFGIGPESTTEDHIRAGLMYIQSMDDHFKEAVPDQYERSKFVIASYNLGEGHVWDAIALAEKHKRNPQMWDNNVEYFLIAKSQPAFYNDKVVKYGYCKGKITSYFVKSIYERYEHYRNIFPE